MDILRGKVTEKVTQHRVLTQISTFGIGADHNPRQWRALLRQLIAREAVQVDATHYNTLPAGCGCGHPQGPQRHRCG
jgi:ATP-dependent DNA helicase RecQ